MAKETFKIAREARHQLIAKERLYLTADSKRVVREGDKEAAFLLAAVGQAIPNAVAEQYGLGHEPEAKGTAPEARSTRPATPSATR